MPTGMLLIVRTALRRYALRHDDLIELRAFTGMAELRSAGTGRTYVGVELGEMLDPHDRSTLRRRHALVVSMRRRFVALLVDTVETFVEMKMLVPLPPLLRMHLREPWAIGVLPLADDLAIALDARALARSVLGVQR